VDPTERLCRRNADDARVLLLASKSMNTTNCERRRLIRLFGGDESRWALTPSSHHWLSVNDESRYGEETTLFHFDMSVLSYVWLGHWDFRYAPLLGTDSEAL
jgi:hypothetical protein